MTFRNLKTFSFILTFSFLSISFQNCAKNDASSNVPSVSLDSDKDHSDSDNQSILDSGNDEQKIFTAETVKSGTRTSFNLSVNIRFNKSHIGQKGTLFIASALPNGNLYFLGAVPNQFSLHTTGTPVSVGSGVVPSGVVTIEILQNIDLTPYKGAKIYVGYGLGNSAGQAWLELSSSVRYTLIHTVE